MNTDVERDIAALRSWIEGCPKGGMVFFGGAGVSTESGIPDFRSADGLYSQKFDYPPETMVSRSFFDSHTSEFFDFYCERMIALDAKPNQAHVKLAELEEAGTLSSVVTQNIDGLHQAAGSEHVWELHGSVHRNHCMSCGKYHDVHELLAAREESGDGIPRCSCGGVVKPDVVLYEEPLDEKVLQGAIADIMRADLLLIAGTSLVVQPAASLVRCFRGKHLAIVNRSSTPADSIADIVIQASIGEVMDF